MRKTLIGGFSAMALATLLLVPMFAWADPAIVIKDTGCGVIDGNGGFAFADGTITVITSNGNTMLKCKAKGVPNDTGSAVNWDFENTGFLCGTPGGVTEEWHETVSASGNATLTCQVHP